MTGKHKTVELSFMLVRRTKVGLDHFFGLFKLHYRSSCVDDIGRAVKESTINGCNDYQLV